MKFTPQEKDIIKQLNAIGYVLVVGEKIQLVKKIERKVIIEISIDIYSTLTKLLSTIAASDHSDSKVIKDIISKKKEIKNGFKNTKMLDLWYEFIEKQTLVKPKFNFSMHALIDSIYQQLLKISETKTEEEVLLLFSHILNCHDKWDDYEKKALSLKVVDMNLYKIINKVRQYGEKESSAIEQLDAIRSARSYNK